MSWLKSVSSSEDVFDEDVDDISLQNKEWKYNMEKRAKDGFRDGSDAGKQASLQFGFNTGYREGAQKMRVIGQLKGIMSVVRCWCQDHDSPALASVTDMLQRVEIHEDKLVEAMRKAQERPPHSVTEMVDDMDDLNVKQSDQGGDSGCCNKDGDCSGTHGANEHCSNIKDTSEDSSRSYFSTGDSFEQLLKSCLDLVTELGLPEELKLYIQKLQIHEMD